MIFSRDYYKLLQTMSEIKEELSDLKTLIKTDIKLSEATEAIETTDTTGTTETIETKEELTDSNGNMMGSDYSDYGNDYHMVGYDEYDDRNKDCVEVKESKWPKVIDY